MMSSRLVPSNVVSFLALLTITGTATAATYRVESCKEYNRELLPSSDWTLTPDSNGFELLADCGASPVVIRPRYGTMTPYGTGAGMTFTAPKPLAIIAIRYRKSLSN